MRHMLTRSDGTPSRLARPRRILLATALAVASTLSMTIASPAQAQTITLYENAGASGRQLTLAMSSDLSRLGFDNITSSIRNSGARRCAYDLTNYRGPYLAIAPWQYLPWLGSWNDRISSIRRC